MMKTTPWKEYMDRGQKFRIQASYGMDYEFARKNNQAPYFSIAVRIEKERGGYWEFEGGGAAPNLLYHFPKLAKYAMWHLTSTVGPMHYIANAEYWYKKIGKPKEQHYDPDPVDAFKRAIIFGAIPDEKLPVEVPWPEVQAWLKARLPMLMDNFMADMRELKVLE